MSFMQNPKKKKEQCKLSIKANPVGVRTHMPYIPNPPRTLLWSSYSSAHCASQFKF